MHQSLDTLASDTKGLKRNRSKAAAQPRHAAIEFNQLGSLLPAVSARILAASSETLDETIRFSLKEILQSLGLDRGGLLKISPEIGRAVVSHAWFDIGVPVVSPEVNLALILPWTYQQTVVLGKTVAKSGVDSVPAEAVTDRETFVQLGVKSSLAIPLFIGPRVRHIIAVDSLKESYIWPKPFVNYLRLLGEILVSALERRDILSSLETTQARLDLAAASAGAGLWEYDLDSGSLWATAQARSMFHLPQEGPLLFDQLLPVIHPDDREGLTEAIATAGPHGSELRAEYRVVSPDGTRRWMISQGCTHRNGKNGSRRLTGVTLDITQRKQMEQKLLEQVQEISRLRELLEQENTLLRSEAGLDEEKHLTLGNSSAMQDIKVLIEQVAPTDCTVLIQGATGTGKELVAQAIHQLSDRSSRLMITVNCAALPPGLIESELFGREKGAFTGALSRQPGRFELAHGSTLFLDEIAEIGLETQAKLLRVLQDGTFERLGSPTSIRTDVRIIAATNRNLAEEVEKGRFRRDLFYRLNVFPIHVPPLRERVEDIPLLVWRFVNEFGQKMGRKISRIAKEDMERLTAYLWPGNVRELRNVIERAMITSTTTQLDLSHLDLNPPAADPAPVLTLVEGERQHILKALHHTGGKIKGADGAAQLLGINPSTLYSRMRKLGIASKGDISTEKG